jgi:hypothetical protein
MNAQAWNRYSLRHQQPAVLVCAPCGPVRKICCLELHCNKIVADINKCDYVNDDKLSIRNQLIAILPFG